MQHGRETNEFRGDLLADGGKRICRATSNKFRAFLSHLNSQIVCPFQFEPRGARPNKGKNQSPQTRSRTAPETNAAKARHEKRWSFLMCRCDIASTRALKLGCPSKMPQKVTSNTWAATASLMQQASVNSTPSGQGQATMRAVLLGVLLLQFHHSPRLRTCSPRNHLHVVKVLSCAPEAREAQKQPRGLMLTTDLANVCEMAV